MVSAMRKGFTVAELMVASSIMIIVLAQLGFAFIGINRLVKRAYAEGEFALATRELRDKLLFELAPQNSARRYGGFLSAGDQSADYSITATVPFVGATDGARATSLSSSSWTVGSRWNSARADNDCYLVGNIDSRNPTWLMPSRLAYAWNWSTWLDSGHKGTGFVDSEAFYSAKDSSDKTGAYYFLNLKYVDSASGYERAERVAVSVFGRVQKTISGKTFDEN